MPKTPLTHHLVALWFADIAGYSDRAAENERSALQLIEILQSLSRDTVRRYEGRVVKFMGDAVLAEFPSTELAVRAAAALSEQYAKESAATGRAHKLRIGVHVADVAVGSDGDLYGDGVNAAARVQEAAEPGQVVLSEDVWRQTTRSSGISVRVVRRPFIERSRLHRIVPGCFKGTGDTTSALERWIKRRSTCRRKKSRDSLDGRPAVRRPQRATRSRIFQ